MPRPWSQERKKRLSALKAAGRSNTEIAKALGLSREVVVERLQNLQGLGAEQGDHRGRLPQAGGIAAGARAKGDRGHGQGDRARRAAQPGDAESL